MDVSLDLSGRHALVVGTARAARRIVARYRAGGAVVVLVSAGDACARLGRVAAGTDATPPALVVWVDGRQALREVLAEHASRLRIWFVTEQGAPELPRGQVTLVGGGPGDTDLMTVAGRRALAEADVVLFDRLAPQELMAQWAPGAEFIDVGKTPGHHAVPQGEIESLMVDHALRGNRVVRLKGGDPFVFGRGGEEVLACRRAGVPVTVVPGVTSAISVPAAAGIPVTHRDVSRAFTVISGHTPFTEEELAHLVGLGGTIVVLMGVNTLPHLAAGLQRHGMATDMPLAIIERGYSIAQRTTVTSVGGVTPLLATVAPRSPAVIVIGEVVRVAAWDDGRNAESHDLVRTIADLAP
ncbi:uroporphyrin-III C-methyltransferase [Glaciihabitans tibetensis]|uniref:uroporphyrinogen-III C-methyltransferase n=1 Tax=Glaciihabitans tibetensis TaxID=1266600 RepID=A0A2T0V4D5_9MICO|nr:uroporphyrinogen-III C-methyltransferase [Glaciihabitans tibetensis]PRY65014.1 uroporphyrin-III C-methyltransferase [Glaciihabitans tibetensis]